MAFTFCAAGRRNRATADGAKALVATALAITMAIYPSHGWTQPEERAVYVSVVDRAGTPVSDLRAGDFHVRSGVSTCEVLRVSAATSALQIALLVDTRQAVEPYVSNVRTALKSFSREIQDRHERALFALGPFNAVVADYSRDPMHLETGIANLFGPGGGGTSVPSALLDVSRGLRQRGASRPVIVLITPEAFQFDDYHQLGVRDALREANVTLYSIVVAGNGEGVDEERRWRHRVPLPRNAQVPGARRGHVFAGTPLEDQLKRLADALNNQYLVTYSRTGPEIGAAAVDVEVKRRGLRVRAVSAPQDPGVTCRIVETNTSRGQEFFGYQCTYAGASRRAE